MRARAFVFVGVSADGFIAREDGAIDWLEAAHARAPAGEDFGYAAFLAGMDALVMGRHTFELVSGFADWPYGDKPVTVLSRRGAAGVAVPPALAGRVQASDEAPLALLRRLGSLGIRRVYVDGGLAVQSFLREGLVDELIVTTVPVLIGRGRPLFGPLQGDVDLELLDSRRHDGGYVQQRWRVVGPAAR